MRDQLLERALLVPVFDDLAERFETLVAEFRHVPHGGLEVLRRARTRVPDECGATDAKLLRCGALEEGDGGRRALDAASGTAVAPSPARTALAKVRRFIESATGASPLCVDPSRRIYLLYLFAYCANLVRPSYTDRRRRVSSQSSRPIGRKDAEVASDSALPEPSRFPARRNGRRRGADDRAPARHRRIAGDSTK